MRSASLCLDLPRVVLVYTVLGHLKSVLLVALAVLLSWTMLCAYAAHVTAEYPESVLSA